MNGTINLVTDGRLQLTPRAAGILADIIRKALVDQQRRTEPSANECHVDQRS